MNLEYLKYLKCFCNNTSIVAKSYENSSFVVVKGKAVDITNGMLCCNYCNRWYPIENGILIMLPDNLIKKEQDEFILKFRPLIPKEKSNINKVDIGLSRINCNNDSDEDALKKIEMEKRDEQAHIYHLYGIDLHDIFEREHFMRLLNPGYNNLIVELGCGTGRITEDFAVKTENYIAVDFSRKSLELLKNRLKNDILMIQGDVCRVPIRDAVAQYIISAQVFEHIPGKKEQEKFVKEFKRILTLDGQAVLTIYNYSIEKKWRKDFQKKGFHADKIYYDHFTRDEILSYFRDCFDVAELRGINCYLPKIQKIKNHYIRRLIENGLSRNFLGSLLGNIWLLSLRNRA